MTVVATGGSISYAGGKKIHTFTTDGTFVVTTGGDIELLMVAGGASGGVGLTPPYYGGGGGAGGVIYDAALTVAPASMEITIGQGGAAKSSPSANAKGNDGTNTVLSDGAVLIGTLTAVGGGAGAGFGAGNEPNSGGSGGGGVYNAVGAAGTAGQGYKGGDGGGFAQGPAGGGGAGAEGGNYSIGDGGVGLEYSISGVAKYYAGGGAGAGGSVRTGVGGLGGGGDWGEAASYYGGGGSGNYTGGTVSFAGFQGIVIISYDVAGLTGRRVWQNEDGGDMPASTIKGRISTTGIPQDLTVAQVGSILVNGLSADTLADADEFSFWKAASSTLKKITWVNIKATLKTYFDTLYVALNAPITGATKTKITYDAKGLVTAGADATTADIADSTNKRYVTDADLVDIGNLSGTNTGDQDLSGLQPLDADLTAIAGLAPANDDVIQRKAGAWVNRTIAQLTTDIRTVIDSIYVALTGDQTVAGVKTFTSAPTIAPASPTDGTDFLLFTLERAWRIQQALTGGSSMLEFFSDTAGKYTRVNPNSTTAGGLIVADTMPTGTLERLMVEGTGNIKGQVSTLSTTGYAFQRLKNDTGQTLDFGQNGSARTGTVFGIANSTGGVGLSFIAPSTAPLAIGTLGAVGLYFGTNGTLRAEIDSAGNIYLGGGTTNAVKIATGGEFSLIGTATTWEDLRIEPTSRSSGAKAPTFANWKGGLYLYDFDNAALASEKEIFFTVQMPHAWKEGSAVEPHVHWVNKTTGTAGHVVRWGIEYTKSVIGGTFGASTTVYGTTIAGGGDITVADEHMLTDFASIDMTGNTISTILVCRLFRNSSDAADTYTGTAGLLYIDWHYEIDSLGSKTELAK